MDAVGKEYQTVDEWGSPLRGAEIPVATETFVLGTRISKGWQGGTETAAKGGVYLAIAPTGYGQIQ